MASNDLSINVRDHGTAVDEKKKRIKCNYCDKLISGFSRLKNHLGGLRGDVLPCLKVPIEVKEAFRNELLEKRGGSLRRNSSAPPSTDSSESQGRSGHVHRSFEVGREKRLKVDDDTPRRAKMSRSAQRLWAREAKKCIARFVYEAGIEFHTIRKASFQRMVNAIRGHRQTAYTSIPSCEDLKGHILRDALKEMQKYVGDIHKSWERTGCSILLDGWKDTEGRNVINVLVDCPKGTVYIRSADIPNFDDNSDAVQMFFEEVLADVGAQNVVQIITYSASAKMKEVGKQLMDKYRSFFWTVCASHCVQLMLEKFATMDVVKEIMEKAKTIARFIHSQPTALKLLRDKTSLRTLVTTSDIKLSTPFLTLEHMALGKDNLRMFFLSSAWKSSYLASTPQGSKVADLVADSSFWTGAITVLKGTIPLVRTLDLINKKDESQLGYIYETIEQAKETIKEEFNHEVSMYTPFWEVIDEIWNGSLHSPLHAAGYFFNPKLFYGNDFYTDTEIEVGISSSIKRMTTDLHTRTVIDGQVKEYREAKGAFAVGRRNLKSCISPVFWWLQYGKEYPELQRLAIRILSQTCNGGSKYKLKRSSAEKLLSKGRNRIEQQRLTDLVFVQYNLHLQYFESGISDEEADDDFSIYDIVDPWNDWNVDGAQTEIVGVSQSGEPTWMDLDCGGRSGRVRYRKVEP